MGYGTYSADTYAARTQAKINSGTNFAYSHQAKSTGNYKAHPTLDPKKKAGQASPFVDTVMKEARDNPEHPNSTPIAVAFDVTGSMSSNPLIIQAKLKDLFGLLLRRGYVPDPQIMTIAYGDAITDYVPLQVSEFESDNRIDDCLDNLILEGHGGNNGGESSLLAAYFVANHTATDAWDERNKKGYMFFIGDEISHKVTEAQVRKYIGDDEPIHGLTTQEIVAKLQERYHVFFMMIDNFSSQTQRSQSFYTNLFGVKNVIPIEDPNAVAETIALAIGMTEGTLQSLDAGAQDLQDNGSTAVAIRTATTALTRAGVTSNAVNTAVADNDLALSSSKARRL